MSIEPTKIDPPTPEEEVLLKRALGAIRFVRHPAFPGLALMAVLVLGGFVVLGLTWWGAAKITYVALQLPRLVSGGFAGIALIGLGSALFTTQMSRKEESREQQLTDEIIDEVANLMALGPQLRAMALQRRAAG